MPLLSWPLTSLVSVDATLRLPEDASWEVMIIIDYKAWLVRHLGMVFITLVLIVVAQHEAVTFTRVDRASDVTRMPALSDVRFADVRLPNPGRGPTAPLPLHAPTVPVASGAIAPGQDERRNAIL